MSRYLRKIAAGLSLTALVLSASVLCAGQALAVNDAQGIDQAQVSLSQAIAAAEELAGGQAAQAEFENSQKHGPVYEVEVVNGPRVHDVLIDAKSGRVISSVEDMED